MTPEQRAEKIKKLPVWAQAMIDDLDRKIIELRDHIAEVHAQYPNSNVNILEYIDGHGERGLPPDSRIRYKLSDQYGDEISVYIKNGKLEMMGHSSIRMCPSSSNVVYIDIDPD